MFLLKRKSKTEKKEKDKNKNSLDGKYIEHNFTEKEPDVKIDFELDHPEVIKNITELKPNTIKNTYVTSKSMKLSENEQPNLIQEQSVIVVKKEKIFSSNPVKNVGFIIPADDEKGTANTKIGSGDLKSSKEIPPKIGFQVPANLKESDSKRSSKEQKYVFPFYQQSYIKKELDKKDSPVSKYVSAMYPPYQRNYDPIKTPLNPVHADLEIKKTKPTSRKSMPFINVSLIRVKNFDRTRSDGLIKTNLTVPTLKEIGASTESIGKKLRSTGVTTTECFVGKKIYKYGERGTGTKSRGEPQDFQRLRDECLERGVMFEDPEFPPTDSSLFFSKRPDRHFEWLRPGEIVGDPRLFMDGYSRFDVQQGELGDCWLLAAVANLTLIHKRFFQIVPDDQSFHDKYAGIFHFRFWQYGRWIDVVIDDRLPTYRGELVFLHSSEKNEFWSALLEKAYAKLHGSYEALKGGSTCEAMEDFTGGVTEMYELQNVPPNLFKILLKAYERNSLMGCSIEPDPGVLEAETPEGLIRGHAYSITRVKYVEIETPNSSGKIPLIRLRNPWGNEAEWNGPWSDKSPEWRFIPDHTKEELGLNFDNDGEFWMSYRDFTKHFDRLEICNLSPDALTEEDVERGKKRWEMSVFEGEWVRGVTAGGCRNYIDTFHHNPQYRITLTEVDDDDEDNKCTVIVALMQKNRRALRNMGADCLTIGFAMYYLPNPDRVPTPLDMNFFKYNASVARSPTFINLREVSCRFKLPPGTYCIVPSTFEQNEEAEFLLRVFSENKNHMQENDEEVGTCDMDDRVIQPQEPDEIKDDPRPPPQPDDKVREFFLKLAGDDMEVDWMELKEIMDYAMRNETQNRGFSKDVCRSMIAMMDKDGSGKLGFEEFKTLWMDIRNWRSVFHLYDRDHSGLLSAFELRQALNSAGYKLNNHILGVLVHRYGTKEGYIAFDDFIMCAVKLKTMIDTFRSRESPNSNTASFSLEEWLLKTCYS